MATEGNGGLGSSEEVREGQLMDPALERKQMHWLDRRNLQLRFHQSMFPDSFFTERNVEGQDGAPIHVKLIDTSTGDAVRSGPLSCVKLKVVVVEGDFNNEDADDWTREDFERRVVKEREGKRPLLIGNLSVSLEGGVGSLGKFSFTDNSSWTRSKKFRLGVKVALDLWEDIRVREAITNPFVVKDRRGKVYEKHYPPALDDEVWRLETIGKNGPFHKRLHSEGISKVKDFLWLLGIDAQGLREILGSNMKDKTWDTLVEHAKTCDLSGKYHVYYADKMKNSGIVFKNMSELCGLIEDGEYHSTVTLSDSQKVFADTLKKKAYAKWKDVVEYDGLLPLEMNPSKRARPSQTEVVAPESCPSDTDQRVSPALKHVAPRPGLVNLGPAVGGYRGSSSLVSENYEYGSSTAFSSIGDMVSVLSGKYYVYYADNAKNYGVVFKIMPELYGLIEGGEYNSAETLSDSQKVLVDMLVKNARENSMHVVECDDRMLLNMKQSKRASSSRTEVVIEAPQFSLPPLPFSVPPEQTSMNSVVAVGAHVPCQPPSSSVPSGEASKNSMPDSEDCIFGPMLDDSIMDLPSLFQQNLSEKADGNTSLDAFWREAGLSDSHLQGSSLDPPEQAGGNAVLPLGDGGSFERGGGSNSPWIYDDQVVGNNQYGRNLFLGRVRPRGVDDYLGVEHYRGGAENLRNVKVASCVISRCKRVLKARMPRKAGAGVHYRQREANLEPWFLFLLLSLLLLSLVIEMASRVQI